LELFGFEIEQRFGHGHFIRCGRNRIDLVWQIFFKETEKGELLMNLRVLKVISAMAVAMWMGSGRILACASCFGQSDSKLAQGMNWGIAVLLAVVGCVLAGISAFFIYVAKRSAAVSGTMISENKPDKINKS
jgi:hypothetical protein